MIRTILSLFAASRTGAAAHGLPCRIEHNLQLGARAPRSGIAFPGKPTVGSVKHKVGLCASLLASISGAACGTAKPTDPDTSTTATTQLTFDQWKETVRVRGLKNVYAVGDKLWPTGLAGDDDALLYYNSHYQSKSALIIDNGQLAPGDPVPGPNYAFPPGATLTYCIDRVGLGKVVTRYGLPPGTDLYRFVDTAFAEAAAAWNTVTGVSIQKVTSRDQTCAPGAGPDNITWYVQPFAVGSTVEFLTFVLAPKYNQASGQNPPGNNKVIFILDYLIQWFMPGAFHASNDVDWNQILTFSGLMERVIANGLGFLDESNRLTADDGTHIWDSSCRDTSVGGIYLSDADPYSVTTLPQSAAPVARDRVQCLGTRPFDFAISYADALGAACQYQANNNYYFYCLSAIQEQVRAAHGADCSPVPLMAGGAGDCNGTSWAAVSSGAKQFADALIWGLIDD
jgi:hypothetical protein